ncbi:hypothetical protein [Streptomyces sp. NBC_00091]|uniref:hypothetical protein n=1 Tax=Streptomyces sp. NBC_00091 TaxID=2975648 RepID=UPI00225110FF|nr:hypothetical protein [Streptomyces sp. NBC_00091]MCX5380448.1 hypothetical protein [Streptomyces sp. NBC_00091]
MEVVVTMAFVILVVALQVLCGRKRPRRRKTSWGDGGGDSCGSSGGSSCGGGGGD